MGDRSGGREAKGSKLKNSKKNPGGVASRGQKKIKSIILNQETEKPNELLYPGHAYIDCGCAILSRQFDRDQDRVFQRACNENVCAIIIWFSDIMKQENLLEVCDNHLGHCYAVCGVHPDNVDRTNKKNHDEWLQKIDELAHRSNCVGILSGLNLSRELVTHFPQESLLTKSIEIIDKLVGLPLILYLAPDSKEHSSLTRAIEILSSNTTKTTSTTSTITNNASNNDYDDNDNSHYVRKVVLHDAMTALSANPEQFSKAINAGLTDPDPAVQLKARQCLAKANIPLSRILVCTDSPWNTPQNLSDTYLRSLRNEPCNISGVVEAIASTLSMDITVITAVLKQNALTVYQLVCEDQPPAVSVLPNNHKNSSNIHIEETNTIATNNNTTTTNNNNNNNNNNKTTSSISNVHTVQNTVTSSTSSASSIIDNTTSSTINQSQLSITSYACPKCRSVLFDECCIVSHKLDAAKTGQKVRTKEAGLCVETIFVDAYNFNGVVYTMKENIQLTVNASNCYCKECNSKLGRFEVGLSTCSCGATVNGPTIRFPSSKLDVIKSLAPSYTNTTIKNDPKTYNRSDTDYNTSSELHTLASIAIMEAATLQEVEELENSKQSLQKKLKTKDKKKKTIQHMNNKGNFSSYRNKSFIPNASRQTDDPKMKKISSKLHTIDIIDNSNSDNSNSDDDVDKIVDSNNNNNDTTTNNNTNNNVFNIEEFEEHSNESTNDDEILQQLEDFDLEDHHN